MKTYKKFIEESAIYDQLRDADYISDPVDKAISKYTLNPDYIYTLYSVFDEAMKQYPNDHRVTLYRGLNFDTEEDYFKFMSTIKNNILETNNISSWSPEKSTAKQFAVTKPSYMEFMDKYKMSLISKQEKERERITGYRGVILSTTIAPKKAVDLSKSDYSKESEMLLSPGKYEVDVYDIKTFKDILATSTADKELQKLHDKLQEYDEEDSSKFLDYIIRNYSDQISDKSKSLLFKMFNAHPFSYRIEKRRKGEYFSSNDNRIIVDFSFPYILLTYPTLFLEKDKKSLINSSKKEFIKMCDDIRDNFEEGYYIVWPSYISVANIAELLGVRSYYMKMLNDTVGKEYRRNDTIEHNKTIKTQHDIADEADRVLKLLRSIV